MSRATPLRRARAPFTLPMSRTAIITSPLPALSPRAGRGVDYDQLYSDAGLRDRCQSGSRRALGGPIQLRFS